MVFTRRVPSELQFGALREGVARERGRRHRRGKPGRVLQHAQATPGRLYRVSKKQIWPRQRKYRSSTSQGSAEPLCARTKGTNRDVSEGKADL